MAQPTVLYGGTRSSLWGGTRSMRVGMSMGRGMMQVHQHRTQERGSVGCSVLEVRNHANPQNLGGGGLEVRTTELQMV